MKLHDRHPCEGTEPVIYIGHREYRKPDGAIYISRTWYAEWCFQARHRHMALKTTNKQVALRKAQDICRRVRSGEGAPKVFKYSIEKLRDDYLALKRSEGCSPKTMEKYTFVLNDWCDWCKTKEHHSAVSYGEEDFWSYSSHMIENKKSEKTIYDRLVLIKQVFKWALKKKHIPENLVAGISLCKPPPNQQPCFTEAQVAIILASAHVHEAAMYACMAYLGLRCGEVRDLKWSDILWNVGKHGFVVIRRGGSRKDKTKTGKVRRIPLNPALRPYLAGIPQKFDRVFTARPSEKHPKGDGPISERRLLRSLKRLCGRCGFDRPNQYKLHTFRHAFASMCARSNVAYKYALEWMGHSSSEILDLYYTMFDDVAERAISTITYTAPSVPVTPNSDVSETPSDQPV